MTDYSPDPGELPTLDWIDVNLLDVGPLYQLPEDEKRVAKIASSFRWDGFGALVVAPKPDGRFSIVDGQHRARAAQAHPAVSHQRQRVTSGRTTAVMRAAQPPEISRTASMTTMPASPAPRQLLIHSAL